MNVLELLKRRYSKMNYKAERISIDDVKGKILSGNYTFALINYISEMVLTDKLDAVSIDWNEIVEARFFSEKNEIHIFEDDDEMIAVYSQDGDENNDYLIKKLPIMKRGGLSKIGKKLVAKQYLAYDEDGQAEIKFTRLIGVE